MRPSICATTFWLPFHAFKYFAQSSVIPLLLHVVFTCSFTLLLKWSQMLQRDNIVTVGAINYILAAIVALPTFLLLNPQPTEWGAIWTGGAMGSCYFIAFFFVIYAIKTVGASSTTVISVLSISMPITFSALFYDEWPSAIQTTGIVLAMFSLSLISGNRVQTDDTNDAAPSKATDSKATPTTTVAPWVTPVVLLSFFLLCGFNRMFQEAFKRYDIEDHRPAFLLAGFTMAAIPSLIVLIRNRRWPSRSELGFGIAIGLSNLLQTLFILWALQHLQGYIVFTAASAGAILLTTLIATTAMKEGLSRRAGIGIAIAVLALFLLVRV